MKIIVLERNRIVGRRIARIWGCAGMEVVCVEDPANLPDDLQHADVLGLDAFDGDVVLGKLRHAPKIPTVVMWSAEPLVRVLRFAGSALLLGRPAPDAPPRDVELVMLARRLHSPTDAPPFGAYLSWGASGFHSTIHDSAQGAAAVQQVHAYLVRHALPRRLADMFGELAHELVMNALYDAPVDGHGRARHAHDRKSPVTLAKGESVSLRLGCDGVRLAIQVVDPFGRLTRQHVVDGLTRGLGGTMSRDGGGAGLGFTLCMSSTVGMVFDVVPGQRTEVTGTYDLDLNLREFKTQAKSLCFFVRGARQEAT